jgi:hypothetical protein
MITAFPDASISKAMSNPYVGSSRSGVKKMMLKAAGTFTGRLRDRVDDEAIGPDCCACARRERIVACGGADGGNSNQQEGNPTTAGAPEKSGN